MPAATLQIFDQNGIPYFYEVAEDQAMVRVGQADDNDIVISGPGIADFHLVLYCQQEPYRVMGLSYSWNSTVDGALLSPNVAMMFTPSSVIRVADYELRLLAGPSGNGEAAYLPAPMPTTGPEDGYNVSYPAGPVIDYPAASPMNGPAYRVDDWPTRPSSVPYNSTSPTPIPVGSTSPNLVPYNSPTPVPIGPTSPNAMFSDKNDDVIQVDLLGFSDTSRILKVDAGEENSFQISIANNGERNAEFKVEVEGITGWYKVSGGSLLEIRKRETGMAFITITPPRAPSSRTGTYHFVVKVSSPNHYPGRFTQKRATLIVNPYYEFSVGELTPKKMVIPWHRRFAETSLTIINKGNSDTVFQVEGVDDEQACSFEFKVPDEEVNLARQAELRLPPDSYTSIPVWITPHSRPLILRRRNYKLTITTTLMEGHHTPRTLAGDLSQKPLIGLGTVLLLGVLLLVLIAFIFRPTISTFRLYEGGKEIVVKNGTPAALYWKGGMFTTLRIDPEPNPGLNPLPDTEGTVVAMPKEETVYTLKGDNLLSRLLPIFAPEPKEVRVLLTPIPPVISFQAQPETIIPGEKVALSWVVNQANKVVLIRETNGVQAVIPLEEKQQMGGQIEMDDVEQDTVFALSAENDYAQATPVARQVRVVTPTPPPIATPRVVKFIVYPAVVVAGTPVMIEWAVEGADEVSVQPIGNGLPAIQSVSQSPTQSINYVLNASYQGAKIPPMARQVLVTPAPTATLEPEAPIIEYFTASSQEVIQGDMDHVDLAWSIKGKVTDVQINGPGFGTITNLDTFGTFQAPINETTMFVLTAFNGDKKSNTSAQVKVLTPTPTATKPPPPTAPPTRTPTPPKPMIIFFNVKLPDEGDEVTSVGQDAYEVIAGGEIYFTWEVQNATKVTLSSPNGTKVDLPFKGEWPQKITSDGNYQLIAENSMGETDIKLIQINMTIEVPPAPFNIRPTELTTKSVILVWDYNRQDESRIQGFTIYEIDSSGGRMMVSRTLNKDVRNYSFKYHCGREYVVVAVYTDINGDTQEAGYGDNSNVNSWYSGPDSPPGSGTCPPE